MIRTDQSLSKNALNLGAAVGLLMGGLQLLAYIFNFSESNVLSWTLTIILIVAISYFVRRYRDETGGFIDYSQSLGFGLLLTLGASLIFGFTHYLYIKFLEPEYIQKVLELTEMALYEAEYEEEMIETFMEMNQSVMGPGTFAFGMFFNYFIIGLLASLVISFFAKRSKPIFEE